MSFKQYKLAKLYSNIGDEQWYVYYSYLDETTGKYKRFKEYFDINRVKSQQGAKMATLYGKEIVDFINDKLKSGWSPFEKDEKRKVYDQTCIKQLDIIIAELSAGASKSKHQSLSVQYNRLVGFLKSKVYEDIPMKLLPDCVAEEYKVYMLKSQKSIKTINESLSYATRFFRIAMKRKWIEVNHFEREDRLKKTDAVLNKGKERFAPITAKELNIIFPHLRHNKENDFCNFLAFIYYGFIRPAEIAKIKVKDIDLANRSIRIAAANAKNKTSGYVQLVPPLYEIVKRMNLNACNPEFYVFSSENNAFTPGPTMLDKNRGLLRWRKYVKTKLRIDKDMYALKHSGNIDYLRNNSNPNMKWLQNQNRHSSIAMTERYSRNLGAFFIDMEGVNFHNL